MQNQADTSEMRPLSACNTLMFPNNTQNRGGLCLSPPTATDIDKEISMLSHQSHEIPHIMALALPPPPPPHTHIIDKVIEPSH